MNANQLKGFYNFLKAIGKVRTQSEFAESIGKSRQYMSAAMNETETLTDNVVFLVKMKYPQEFKMFEGWGYQTNYDEVESILRKQTDGGNNESESEKAIEKIRRNKIYGNDPKGILVLPVKVQGGYSLHYKDPIFINDLSRTYIPNNPYDGEDFLMAEMEGDSMEYIDDHGRPAGIPAGSWMIFERVPQELWQTGLKKFYVHLVVTDTLFTIKRILQDKPDEIVLHPDNDLYFQQRVHLKDVKQIWIMKRRLDWNAPPPRKIEINV
jgi:hypothetical protein